MSRKDYQAIADAIRPAVAASKAYSGEEMAKIVAERIATALQEDNPRFKREVFMKACGL